MKKGFLILIALLLFIPLALGASILGASIHGKVFTYSLKPATNSIISINTVPEQVVVSVDGTYSFNVPVGDYTITAVLKDEFDNVNFFVETNISIVDDGDYVRDLILFPQESLDELELEKDLEQELEPEEQNEMPLHVRILISIGIIIILGFIVWLAIRDKGKKKDILGIEEEGMEENRETGGGREHNDGDELTDILAFIRKHKRVTQKELRKNFPLSEAKISLIITDLESQGKIRKIKKGRGNIIVYKEKEN